MEKRCKVCGTAEKVNFDGMCQKCYEDSIEIHENETMEDAKNKTPKSFWKDKKNVAIVILSVLLVCGFLSIPKQNNLKELNAELSELKQQAESQILQIAELKDENQKIKTLENEKQNLTKEKEELTAKLEAVPSIEELQKTIEEKSAQIASLETQISTLTTEKTQLAEQNGTLQQQLSSAQKSTGTSTTSTTKSVNNTEETAGTVYITNTGSKYHRAGCSYLRSSQNAIGKNSAISQGYTACSIFYE